MKVNVKGTEMIVLDAYPYSHYSITCLGCNYGARIPYEKKLGPEIERVAKEHACK